MPTIPLRPRGSDSAQRPDSLDTPCPCCGGAVGCAMHAPGGCWCARMPLLTTVDARYASCLCAGCLAQLLEQQVRA